MQEAEEDRFNKDFLDKIGKSAGYSHYTVRGYLKNPEKYFQQCGK